MSRQIFDVSENARVQIRECEGRVSVYGAEGTQVIVETESGTASQENGAIVVAGAAEQDDDRWRGTIGSGGVKIRAESTRENVIVRVGEARREHAHRVLMHHHIKHGAEFAHAGREMGREIRQKVRESLAESLGDFGMRHRQRGKWGARWMHACEAAESEMPAEERPRGPAAGSPERKGILDAVARGEINVDEAIKKIRGES